MYKSKILPFFIILQLVFVSYGRNTNIRLVEFPPVLCYGIDSDMNTQVLPDKNFLKSVKLNQPLTFIPIYDNISASAKVAFEYALSQWSQYLNSPIPIRIKVTEDSLAENVLASAGPSGFYSDIDGLMPGFYYPITLIEKILQVNLNEESADINIKFSNDAGIWYYGTDGNTPAGKYDFVSTIMHEICHGLGFIGSMKLDDNDFGKWGYGGINPMIFDNYVMNGSSQFLIDESIFTNPSLELKNQYTSNNLYFSSYISLLNNPEYGNPRLYAPVTFDQGSSIYHLNDATYPAGNINSLMTHATGTAESIHVPGPLTVNMLEEIGWVYTYINHNKQKDIDDISIPVTFSAIFISDKPADTPMNYVFYKSSSNTVFDSLLMTETGDEYFEKEVVFNEMDQIIQYYFKSTDKYNKTYKYPANSPDSLLSFYIGEDTIKPKLKLDAFYFVDPDQKIVDFSCEAWDNLGVDTVFVEYTINLTNDFYSFGLIHDSLDVYKGVFDFTDKNLQLGDIIEYYVTVIDKSKNKNQARFHNEDMIFTVDSGGVRDQYQQNFDEFTADFSGITKVSSTNDIKFLVSAPEGFDNACLHTPNPYKSAENISGNYNYIAQLRIPVKLKANSAMRFDEIVLVEPGELGATFGTDGFWDYVVVEVSKDDGDTWFALKDGYDSRENIEWFTKYRSVLDADENSLAIATPGLYKSNYTRILDNSKLKEGDTILFRFRLYSDQYAHGWGWAIDNLDIQGPNAVDALSLDDSEISIFPNPANDKLNIYIKFNQPVEDFSIYITDIYGTGGFAFY